MDRTAAIVNVVGREHHIGRARSRPTTRRQPARAEVNALQINAFVTSAEHALA